MYADPTARGGVLETEGTLDVKFRKKDVLATMHRLDEKLQTLSKELVTAGADGARSKEAITKDLRARETLLFPAYHQVATQFADLHDTPGRMEAKGCLQGTVSWSNAREFFYWRLQRRLAECRWVKRITAVLEETAPRSKEASLVVGQEQWRVAQKQLDSWVASASASADTLKSDKAWFSWYKSNDAKIESQFAAFKSAQLLARMQALIASNAGADASASAGDATVGGLASLIGALTAEQKAALKKIFA